VHFLFYKTLANLQSLLPLAETPGNAAVEAAAYVGGLSVNEVRKEFGMTVVEPILTIKR
jgi:hypothetical protein